MYPVVTAAVEGDLDEAVLRRIADHAGVSIGNVYGRHGKPALLKSMPGYNNAAQYAPWVVLVDLDRSCDCAPPCVRQWLPQPSALMCFRAVVRAIEAWLLADRERIAAWLGIAIAHVPTNPEELHDPKQALVNLARRSRRRRIRDDMVPRDGSGRPIGALYNDQLIQFVEHQANGWRPDRASQDSDSLARCLARIGDLADLAA